MRSFAKMTNVARLAVTATAAMVAVVGIALLSPSSSPSATVRQACSVTEARRIGSRSGCRMGRRYRNGELGRVQQHPDQQVPWRADLAQQVHRGAARCRGDHLLDELPRRRLRRSVRPSAEAGRLADRLPSSQPQCRGRPAPSSSRGLRTSPWAGTPRSTLCSSFARASAATLGSSTPGKKCAAVSCGRPRTAGDTIRVWIVKVDGTASLHPSRDNPGSRVAQQGGGADRPIDPVRLATCVRTPLRRAPQTLATTIS